MCTANFQSFMAKAGKFDLAGRVRAKTNTKDPLMKSLGYEGIDDPLTAIEHGIRGEKTDVSIKATRNRNRRAQKATDAERPGTTGHIQAIAAMKAKRGARGF